MATFDADLLALETGVDVVATGRRMTVVVLDDEGPETTVVLPPAPLLKRIGWPGRMVYGAGMPLRAASSL
ncbi:hypothetical protein PS627_01958 [Pseudomonas fluorescens]|nr:hypothetical protein PS627_01958 [Pseudomonas fluorescens]